MKRRQAEPSACDSGAEVDYPKWIRWFVREDWWDEHETAPADCSLPGSWRLWQAKRRHGAAVEAWCVERGYSYCMTALGWRHPAPNEVRAGLTRVPPGWAPGSPHGDRRSSNTNVRATERR